MSTANAAGNFYRERSMAFPLDATLVYDGRVVTKATPVTDGDGKLGHGPDGPRDPMHVP